jgi:hypothetical protein
MEFWNERSWEPKTEETTAEAVESANTDEAEVPTIGAEATESAEATHEATEVSSEES